ncbi:uncharacterized protein A1O9_11770 [Exophiala aquamarina CBS 119918]|uniref:DUF6536 domain-containing protein n=1 Tax=Exophiala aquamarina CBS 119918 TaxID=1182545 RepID=A0A072NW79_9EURO|nr:uncharacterized protein A1O9_11770 [Exophiala aquamarina CBS 119918]KEF52144.1 hypothetical protein A1O9_11770 [Exophiala aquamarina CBS 119918]
MNIWLHLALNVISTLLLGDSNYCMQCLSAATRSDINRAHTRGKWLDVGVPSTRNPSAIPKYKALLWLTFGLTCIPLHLMYNSAFYKSLSTNNYDIFVVEPGFLEGGSVDTTGIVVAKGSIDPAIIQTDLGIAGRYIRLNNSDCINTYATDINSRRNPVLVSSKSTPAESTLLHVEHYSYTDSVGPRGIYKPYGWICADLDLGEKLRIIMEDRSTQVCETYAPKIAAGLAGQWTFKTYPVDFCLSEVVLERCGYSGNVPIISVVIICNAVKFGIMLFVALHLRDDPLIMIGDAVESFLDHADE